MCRTQHCGAQGMFRISSACFPATWAAQPAQPAVSKDFQETGTLLMFFRMSTSNELACLLFFKDWAGLRDLKMVLSSVLQVRKWDFFKVTQSIGDRVEAATDSPACPCALGLAPLSAWSVQVPHLFQRDSLVLSVNTRRPPMKKWLWHPVHESGECCIL